MKLTLSIGLLLFTSYAFCQTIIISCPKVDTIRSEITAHHRIRLFAPIKLLQGSIHGFDVEAKAIYQPKIIGFSGAEFIQDDINHIEELHCRYQLTEHKAIILKNNYAWQLGHCRFFNTNSNSCEDNHILHCLLYCNTGQ